MSKVPRSVLLSLVLMSFALPMLAQPYGAWLTLATRTPSGYITVPHHPAFNFTNAVTFEAWVAISDPGACSSILGKEWTTNYWVGICGTKLRSYFNGTTSLFDSGTVPANNWTHIAVVFDNGKSYHYVDGELTGSRDEAFTTMGTSTTDFRIGSDSQFAFSTAGAIDEVRVWNVARTQAQIRAAINTPINSPQTGLVAVYHLDGSGADSVGGHNGSVAGTGAAFLTSPVTLNCGTSSGDSLCLESSRFSVSVEWLTADGARGTGHVVPGSSAGSGLFWFFAPDNWELLVKVLNGCGVNSRKWAFSAATTNVHYELAVTDVRSGVTKRYFNYQAVSAPAVTDTGAFATCP
ncbi:MAG TPA: LamG domain-containing protein [Thermoanaerobaculia bacterium]|nr:LamG domain-containing protein [Thermoanaerobaculia bacterium]